MDCIHDNVNAPEEAVKVEKAVVPMATETVRAGGEASAPQNALQTTTCMVSTRK